MSPEDEIFFCTLTHSNNFLSWWRYNKVDGSMEEEPAGVVAANMCRVKKTYSEKLGHYLVIQYDSYLYGERPPVILRGKDATDVATWYDGLREAKKPKTFVEFDWLTKDNQTMWFQLLGDKLEWYPNCTLEDRIGFLDLHECISHISRDNNNTVSFESTFSIFLPVMDTHIQICACSTSSANDWIDTINYAIAMSREKYSAMFYRVLDVPITREGWLTKLDKLTSSRRWFVLTNKLLCWFSSDPTSRSF